ncbi:MULTISPECIES: MFS transporter [Streptomyces]|uniref:MFS transporter n=1 Tax=Streptomyces spirodelae TaxID=2812904 RepID=A0ABS3X2W9_9ACTN|nr:MFS transporter [Streptomyces spirodelae]MBO8189704.1 MFS transporter [Streptomyces spirodelae]
MKLGGVVAVSTWNGLALRWSLTRHFSPLTWVLASTFTGVMGTWVLTLTMPWFVFATTGSTSHAGMVVFAELAPAVVARFLAGPVLDRVGLRRMSVVTSVVETVCVTVIAVLVTMDRLPFPLLLALLALMGAAGGAGTLAKSFLAPSAARYVGFPEGRGISLSSAMMTAGQVFGPSLGAFLAPEPVAGLIVVAALFTASALIIGLALPHGMEPEHVQLDPTTERLGYWRSLGEGIRYFRKDGLLVRLYVMLALMGFLVAPMNGVFLPLWAQEADTGPGTIGALVSMAALAGFVGSLVAVPVIERVRPVVILAAGYLLIVPQLLVLALGAPTWVVMAAWVAAGFAGAFPYAVVGKITYRWPPAELRSRTSSLGGSISKLGAALGGLAAGFVVDHFGLMVPLLAGAVLYFVVTQGTVFRKDMRGLTPKIREDRPKEVAEVPVMEEPVR